MNPVHARLAEHPEDWQRSSARAHLHGARDPLCDPGALGRHVADWRAFLAAGISDASLKAIRAGERTGRPLGDAAFVAKLEVATGRAFFLGHATGIER